MVRGVSAEVMHDYASGGDRICGKEKMMDNNVFEIICIDLVLSDCNSELEHIGGKIGRDDVFVVWKAKILKNNKAMVATTLCDGVYYEITYNGDRNAFYIDKYRKESNVCLDEEEWEENYG